jgi:tetratricopeptide (TPR) repeat protein
MNGVKQAHQISIAMVLQRRFEETRNVDDITQVISHCENAISLISSGPVPNHPLFFAVYNFTGNAYLSRFTCIHKLQDLDHAISHHQKAVQSTPSDHRDLPKNLKDLGNSYLLRFEYTGDLQDTERAISHYKKAVKSAPSGHPDLLAYLSNLGNSYSCRFLRTGNPQDIEDAISLHQKVVGSTPSDHADLSLRTNNLGNSYSCRYQRSGNLQDINHAISYHQKAVECAPSGYTDCFTNLGNSYLHRFKYSNDLQDIDDAIFYHQKAIQSTPSGHAKQFNNLGNSYATRFKYTDELQDINHAIFNHQKAVQSTPSGHAELPRWFGNLGTSYSGRFQHSGNLQDIDHAISYHQKAVQSTPSGHPQLPAAFNDLANSYIHRFKHSRDCDPQDIDRAIIYHQKAVESTASDHPDLPGWFSNLGSSYLYRFSCTDHLPDVQNSIASYREAAKANGAPSIRARAAGEAAILSSVHDRSQCLTDFALAISLLSEAAGLEQTIPRRHANLQGLSNIVVGYAVATALHFSRANSALEWFEQGRCLVWNQLNQLRTPIDNLRTKYPSLANRFIEVATALESYGTRPALSLPLHTTLVEAIRLQDVTLDHTRHATEYKQLLEEIRALPDFHDFLQPPKASDILSSLPSNGPLVIFNIHKTRCDALAIIAGIEEPLHIPLENFSLVQAEELQAILRFDLLKQREVEDQDRMPKRVRPHASSMLFVLKELWCKVVQPILEALGYSVRCCL